MQKAFNKGQNQKSKKIDEQTFQSIRLSSKSLFFKKDYFAKSYRLETSAQLITLKKAST